MPKKYDVVAITGEYTDSQGKTKKRYLNCGAIFEKDGKFSLKLEAIPVESNGWFGLYPPKSSKETAQQGTQQAQAAIGGDFDDDIPF
jgi:hypothetical protein